MKQESTAKYVLRLALTQALSAGDLSQSESGIFCIDGGIVSHSSAAKCRCSPFFHSCRNKVMAVSCALQSNKQLPGAQGPGIISST